MVVTFYKRGIFLPKTFKVGGAETAHLRADIEFWGGKTS